MKFKATLYYALGEGLGSLARAQAVQHTLGLEELRVVTAVEEAGKVFHSRELLKIPGSKLEPTALRNWLRSRLNRYEFESVYIDTFPFGLLGELEEFLPQWEGKIHYVARSLRLEAYESRFPQEVPRFARSLIVEPLPEAQQKFIQANSDLVESLALEYPPAELPAPIQALVRKFPHPIWLILHAGPQSEVDELLQQARQLARQELATPSWLVCTQCAYRTPYRDVHIIQQYPAWPLLEHVEKVFTGCGFNSMRQMKPFAEKHQYLPFVRKYDDQEARAQLADG